jgi:hypothetical protein
MCVPDFELICEIMLVAEGFQEARVLARKFITLYTLCKELLSKQDHYDWGLRAIKSVLVVAGSLKVTIMGFSNLIALLGSVTFMLTAFMDVTPLSSYRYLNNDSRTKQTFLPIQLSHVFHCPCLLAWHQNGM